MTTDRARRTWLIIHLAALAAAGVILLYANRGQWFFGDEWEFLVNRGFDSPRFDLWRPHNEHWSTIPIIVTSLLRDVFGLGTYWPFIGVLVLAHLGLAHLLWRVSLRAGAAPAIATAGAIVFSLLGAGSENLLWAFQIGFIGSVLFGWWAMLVGATEDRLGKRDIWVVVLLLCSLMCAGLGVPMVAGTVLAILVRSRSWLRAAVVGAPPTIAFVIWYVLVGDVNARAADPEKRSGSLLERFVDEAHTVAERVTGAPHAVVTVLLLAGTLWAVWAFIGAARGVPSLRVQAAPLGGLGAAWVFLTMLMLGRGELGSSRYLYVVTAMLLPFVMVTLSLLAKAVWAQGLVVAALALVAAFNVNLLFDNAHAEATREAWVRNTVIAAGQIAVEGEPTLNDRPEPVYNPDITVEALRRFVTENGLDTDSTPLGTNTAWLSLGVSVGSPSPVPLTAGAPSSVQPSGVTETTQGRDSCWVPEPGAAAHVVTVVAGSLPSEFRFEPDVDTSVGVGVGGPGDASEVRQHPVPAGDSPSIWVELPAGTTYTIHLPPVASTLCLLG